MADMLKEMYRDWHVIRPENCDQISEDELEKFRVASQLDHIIANEYFKPTPLPRIQLFTRLMLGHPWRDYVINFVKDPLRRAIIKAKTLSEIFRTLKTSAKRIPVEITRRNCKMPNTHVLFDIEDKFFEYEKNGSRIPLYRAAFKIYKSEVEHDTDYSFRGEWLLEEQIKTILDGRWKPRPEGAPHHSKWKEPEPYGGKHSIIYKLQQKREEIKKLLEV